MRNGEMRDSARAISELAAIVTIIVIGAAITTAVFFLIPGQSTTSSTQPSKTTSFTTTITSNFQQVTTQAHTISSITIEREYFVSNLAQLFGNFSSMSFSFSKNNNASSEEFFVSRGTNSTYFYKVAFDLRSNASGSEQNSTLIIWFDGSGNPTLATANGQNVSGSSAKEAAQPFLAGLTGNDSVFAYLNYVVENQTVLSKFTLLNESRVSYGATSANVSYYLYSGLVPMKLANGEILYSSTFGAATFSSSASHSVLLTSISQNSNNVRFRFSILTASINSQSSG